MRNLLCQTIKYSDDEAVRIANDLRMKASSEPSLEDLVAMITKISQNKPTFLVLDAADELEHVKEVLATIQKLVTGGMRVLLTSRNLLDVSQFFTAAVQIQVRSDPHDLQLYVEHKFASSDFAGQLSKGHAIIKSVVDKASNL